MRVGIQVVVGSHDGRVAPGVASAEIAFFKDRQVAQSVLFGKVVGGGETVAAAADNDRVVTGFGARATPGERPALVVRERVAGERENRVLQGAAKRLGRRSVRLLFGSAVARAPDRLF